MTDLLEAKGIRTIVPTLPTNNGIVPPNMTFQDDIDLVRGIVAKEVEAGTHLTVMAHSYGGAVASAALGRYALTDISKGGVNHICFVASFPLKEGQSLVTLFNDQMPPQVTEGPEGTAICNDPVGHFYHDLSPSDQQEALDMLVPFQWDAQFNKLDSREPVAWRKIPASYVICEDDAMLPAMYQQMIIDMVAAEGVKMKEFRVPSSHTPFWSMPQRMVEITKEVMDSVAVRSIDTKGGVVVTETVLEITEDVDEV